MSVGLTSLGQAGSGPVFEKPFSARMGGSFSPIMILYVLSGRSFLPVIASYLQPTLLFWSLEITAHGVPPKSRPPNPVLHFLLAGPLNRFPQGPGPYYQVEKGLEFINYLLRYQSLCYIPDVSYLI